MSKDNFIVFDVGSESCLTAKDLAILKRVRDRSDARRKKKGLEPIRAYVFPNTDKENSYFAALAATNDYIDSDPLSYGRVITTINVAVHRGEAVRFICTGMILHSSEVQP